MKIYKHYRFHKWMKQVGLIDQNLKDAFDKLSKVKGKEIEDYIHDQLK